MNLSLRVRSRVAAAALLLFVAGTVSAMWERMTDAELIDRSDLVVFGTLIGHSALRTATEDLLLGVVRIDRVYKGAAGGVAFVMLPPPRPVSSTDLRFSVGQTGLWFLRLRRPDEQGIYLADHPQRFTAAAQAAAQVEALMKRAAPK